MKQKICFVVSNAMTVNAFLQQPIRKLSEHYDIYLALNLAADDTFPGLDELINVVPVCIERKISPLRDLLALSQLAKLFLRHNFKLVHSVTPKAGLLAMIAAYVARIDIRIHTFTGQVWVTRAGFKRWLLKSMDKLIGVLATSTLADSGSQRQFLLNQGVLAATQCNVLAKGSISGVDTQRFKPDSQERSKIRNSFGIADTETVFLFMGRLNSEKGVVDLAAAFSHLKNTHTRLLIVGPDEQNMRSDMERLTKGCAGRVHFVDFSARPQEYMAAADVLCLPSYREGFGNVVIEAASVGIPAIGSRIYGIIDSIEENYSGLLFEPHDVSELESCMSILANDATMRFRLGKQARERVLVDFTSEKLALAWLEYYQARL